MNLGAEIDLLEDKYKVMIFMQAQSTFAPRICIVFSDKHKYFFTENMTTISDYPQLVLKHTENYIISYLPTLRKKKLERICQS